MRCHAPVGQGYRVICPDTVGRGSARATDPVQQYQLSFYAAQARTCSTSWALNAPLGGHLDGRGHRHPVGGRPSPASNPASAARVLNDNAPPAGPASHRAHVKAYAGQRHPPLPPW